MKMITPFFSLSVTAAALLLAHQAEAQCNVNEKYDKIVSGYHQSIALKSDNSFSAWGQAIAANGTGDFLTPQAISVANFAALTGTPLKATIGGQGSSSTEQMILLTSTGLFAWGAEGNVLDNSLTSSAAFAKIGTPTNGDATTKLPTGVAPADVASLFATYKTLVVLTNSGHVWVLTQMHASLQGDATALSATTWHKVKTDASNYLSGVTAIRGQVSTTSASALMAVTSSGSVYVWGSSVYLGSGAVTSASYATAMTLPAVFSASYIPKMIGVTGGTGGTSTVKNTFYVLANNGVLYAVGDNSKRQCGDFTTTERTSWVKVKKTSAANDTFTNVNFISVQEHDASYPGVAAITTTGDLYTWGENNGLMLGRVTDGTAYDPGFPGGFTSGTDKAVSTELGGHTLVYIKEGSSQFCYVGHKRNGSMGDGSATNTNISTFNCSGTPVLDICGYVPVSADVTRSTISAAQQSIAANGSSTTTVTIQLKDATGTNLTVSGGVVIVYTSAGTLGTVTDNNNGTYTVVLTSASSQEIANLTFSVNGSLSANSTNVTFQASLPVIWRSVSAQRAGQTVRIDFSTHQEMNVSYFEVERSLNGTNWTALPGRISPTNRPVPASYQVVDRDYIVLQLFYRIKEFDLNGLVTYSPVKTVYAEKALTRINVYPVPASTRFYLNNVNTSMIREVRLLSESGTQVKVWKKGEVFYDIVDLPKGVYFIRLELNDGTVEQLRISKY